MRMRTTFLTTVIPFIVLVLCFGTVDAAPITWIGVVNSSWHTSGNWDLNRVPGPGDDVVIPETATPSIQYTAGSITVGSLTCADVLVLSGGTLTTSLPSTSSKSLTIQGGTLVANSTLDVTLLFSFRSGALSGTGTTRIHSVSWNLATLGNCTLTQTLENYGTCTFDNASFDLIINSPGVFRNMANGILSLINGDITGTGSFVNETSALLHKTGVGSTSVMSGVVTNNGTVRVDAGRLLDISNNLTNLSAQKLTGGAYELTGELRIPTFIDSNAASITLVDSGLIWISSGGNAINNLTNAASGMLHFMAGPSRLFVSFINAGLLVLSDSATVSISGNYTQTGGETRLGSSILNTIATINIQNGLLTGTGRLYGNVINDGTVRPGFFPGLQIVQGSYKQTPGGILEIEIAGNSGTQVGLLSGSAVFGNANLNGQVTVSLLNGFIPAPGSSIPFITAGSVSHVFSTENLPSLLPHCASIDYQPASVNFKVSTGACAGTDWTSEWYASNSFPGQFCPWTGFDNATPESPSLSGDILTMATSDFAENMYYSQSGSLAIPDVFILEASLRFVSESHAAGNARRGAAINFTVAPDTSNILFVGRDTVFIWSDVGVQGPTAYVDTDDAFHTYRIEVRNRQAIKVFQDNSLILTGNTTVNVNYVNFPYLWFGEGTDATSGTSEWRYVRHTGSPPCGNVSGVPDVGTVPAPSEFAMVSRQNPTRGPLTLDIQSSRDLDGLTVTICDVTGRLIRTVAGGPLRQGTATLTWDGRGESGNVASSGIYFVRLESGGRILARTRVVMLR